MSELGFVHLRCRSAFSLLEGALQPADIARLCKELRQPAAAITDANNLFGALEFSEALKGAGIQPIIGLTLSVHVGGEAQWGRPTRSPDGVIALLAQNEQGYRRLMALSSTTFLDGDPAEEPLAPLDDVLRDTDGLICLTGGPDGIIDRAFGEGRAKDAEALLARLADAFPDRLYVELQRHGAEREKRVEPHLLEAAARAGLPAVATNEPYFERAENHAAHDALLCVADGTYLSVTERRRLTPRHNFANGDDMAERFADLPEALANTLDIARRCAFRVETRAPILPSFGGADGRSEADELAAQAEAGLRARLAAIELAAPEEAYWERLRHELDVITQMGFPGYFLIVADFIKWAKAKGVSVGPGRGSGAGSVVAWALTITNLDPLRFGLLFERFLNPERVSMPDFDIDFCQERRGEVIEYVKERYGADRVAQIITFGKLQARAVLRDVGRVMQLPLGMVDRLAKMVPNNPANPVTLAEAVAIEPRLQAERDREPEVARLLSVSLELEGLYRNASTHAAGVVIGDRPLTELVALYQDPRSDLPATQFNMKWVEQAGLVKFDFLGLKTLTVIERALTFLRQRGVDLDLEQIAFDDEATYTLLSSGAAIGVFQLESTGMRETLRKLQPDKLEDIIALISLYRPGPMKNIDIYVDRKFGRAEIDYLHPSLEPVLKETYGVIIYQEQVMQIAQILSGYSLGEADLLRRAMGKKKREEMARQKVRFLDGAKERGVSEQRAAEIFDLVEEFAGYGFNKSHAAAYALIAYHTAYLKANHPVEFMAGLMSLDRHNTEKLAGLVQEARRMGVGVLGPDINASAADFGVEAGSVRYGLGALRNVGDAAMEAVTVERDARGAFQDLSDFAARLDPRQVNKRMLETLAKSGAFDCLNVHRAAAVAAAPTILGSAQAAQSEMATAQSNLFGATEAARPAITPIAEAWTREHALEEERGAVGFFLSGHPLEAVESALKRKDIAFAESLAKLASEGRSFARVCGVVQRRQERRSAKNGERFAFVALSDPTGEFEALAPSSVLSEARDLLEPGAQVIANAKIDTRDGGARIILDSVQALDEALAGAWTGLRIDVEGPEALEALQARLGALPVQGGAGHGPIHVRVRVESGEWVELALPGRHRVDGPARSALKTCVGVLALEDL